MYSNILLITYVLMCTHVYSTDAYAKSAGYNNIHIVGLATDLHVHRLV